MLGAAADDPENGLLPRQLFITDTSGERRSFGSVTDAGETAVLDRAIRLAEGHAGIYLNLDKPGLFQFDFDMGDLSLAVLEENSCDQRVSGSDKIRLSLLVSVDQHHPIPL
jgi:hypothetical protein